MKKTILPPASIVYTGDTYEETIIRRFQYNEKELIIDGTIDNSLDYTEYIKINGFSDIERIKKILVDLNIDKMIIEDIFNVSQRSKIEVNDDTIFIVLKTLEYINGKSEFSYISVILTNNIVISINEKHTEILDCIVQRIQKNTGIIRNNHSAYLLYSIIDVIVDLDMHAITEIEDHLNSIEDLAIDDNLENNNDVYSYRKDLNYLKNSIIALMDAPSKNLLMSHKLVTPDITKYFYDIFDHVYKLSEKISTAKETLRIIYEIQMNNISLNMNKIMQTLTIFSAIFIPLSFLAGVFGMNFTTMPLLQSNFGFGIFVTLCFATIIFMLIFFKKRKFF